VINGEEEFEVEKIIDKHTHCQKKQYLVKWLKYPAFDNSWVNAQDLKAPQLLEKYHLLKA
jgi:hypothetical protein